MRGRTMRGTREAFSFFKAVHPRRKAAAVALGLAGTLLGVEGCQERLGDFTVMSTKNVDLSHFETQKAEQGKRVAGEDSTIQALGHGSTPNLKEAIDQAEERGGGNGLTNVTLRRNHWNVLLFGKQSFQVEGNPIAKP